MPILFRKSPPAVEPEFPVKPTRRSAVSAVLNRHYPKVYQIAVALCGQPAAAAVAGRVLTQSVRRISKWTSDADAGRWFAHYTVLTSRTVVRGFNDQPGSPLGSAAAALPTQQREAFLLHHGLGMTLRELATAMDCSSAAAANHLLAAVAALRSVSAPELAGFTTNLPGELARRLPPPQDIQLQVQQAVGNAARWKFLAGWPLFFALWAVLLYLAWRVWTVIQT